MTDSRPEAGFVFIPLVPGTKLPAVKGWAEPGYPGVNPATYAGPLGLRCDGLVVVDTDDLAAQERWETAHPQPTYKVKSPNGFHNYYAYTPGCPASQISGFEEKLDIKAGSGCFVVVRADGYEPMNDFEPVPADPCWFPAKAPVEYDGDEVEVIAAGGRNNYLASMGGVMRRQGMSAEVIAQSLIALNDHHCVPPLPRDDVLAIALSISRYEPQPDQDIKLVTTSTPEPPQAAWRAAGDFPVRTTPPRWFVQPWWPEGRLVLLDGSEGIGKGLMCAHRPIR